MKSFFFLNLVNGGEAKRDAGDTDNHQNEQFLPPRDRVYPEVEICSPSL